MLRAAWWSNLAVVVPAAAACSFPDIEYIQVNALQSDAGVDATSGSGDDGESSQDAWSSGGSGGSGSSGSGGSGGSGSSGTSAGDDTGDGAVDAGDDGDKNAGDDGGPPIYDGGCNCAPDAMYPTNVTSCGGLLGLLCASHAGFVGSPACGQSGQFITCSLDVLSCEQTFTTRVQQCQ